MAAPALRASPFQPASPASATGRLRLLQPDEFIFFKENPPALNGPNVFIGVNAAATVYYVPGTPGWNSMLGWISTAFWVQFIYTIQNGMITITGYTGSGGAVTIPAPSVVCGSPASGTNAFYGPTNLTKITIPSGVTNVGDWAFASCTSLTNIDLPASTLGIGSYAFNFCTSLADVAIPTNTANIGDYAFNACTGLTNIVIPDSLTNIGVNVFSYFPSLASVTIPGSVTEHR